MTLERKSFQCFFVGTVTDGEFNSLRTMGGKRPISIIQVMMDAKAEARSINVNTVRKYITPKRIQGIFFSVFFLVFSSSHAMCASWTNNKCSPISFHSHLEKCKMTIHKKTCTVIKKISKPND